MHFIDTDQISFLHDPMREILSDIESAFGPQIITSLYRFNDTGVHGQLPLRGVDLRCRNREFGELMELYVNERWKYDYRRTYLNVAVAHGDGNNYHVHLQVHPNTRRRKQNDH